MIYWDTSSLLKLYVDESDSQTFRNIAAMQASKIVISQLHRTEIYYALHFKEMRSEIGKEKASKLADSFDAHIDMGVYLVLPWGSGVAANSRHVMDRCFVNQPKIPIRSLDGIHLGMAYEAGIKRIVTADIRMKDAAIAMGIEVIRVS